MTSENYLTIMTALIAANAAWIGWLGRSLWLEWLDDRPAHE